MAGEIKTDVNRLVLILIMNTNLPLYYAKIELFFNFETRSNSSTTAFIVSTIFQT